MRKGGGVPIDWHVYNPNISPTWKEAWSITEALFHRMNDLCSSKNIVLKVVLFPSIEEVSLTYQQQIQSEYPAVRMWNFESGLETQARTMLLSAGVDASNILSLYSSFTSHDAPDALYYRVDHHWTSFGHALAGEQIKVWLESE